MKNKICHILLALMISFSFINSVYADGDLDFTVSASTAKSNDITVGEEIDVIVSLRSNSYINACTFEISLDSNIEFVSSQGLNNFGVISGSTLNIENPSIDGSAPANGIEVLSLKYKVNGDGKIIIKTKECISPIDENTGSYQDVLVDLKVKDTSGDDGPSDDDVSSDDTTLKTLSVNGQQVSNFDSKIYKGYSVTLDTPNFSLSMVPNNPDYQDDIVVTDTSGNVLNPDNITYVNDGQGVMVVNITVNGKTTYSLGVGYSQPGLDNSLGSLIINGQTVELEVGRDNYIVYVDKNVTSVDVVASLKDSENFKFSDGSSIDSDGTGIVNVDGDETTFAIIIEPKNSQVGGTSRSYFVEIIKKGTVKPSSSSKPVSGGNTTTNPSTGGISMFIMAFILIASLVGSIVLYQKNLESYK